MTQIINSNNYQKRNNKSKEDKKKPITRSQLKINQNEEQARRKLDERILPRDIAVTEATLTSLDQETKDRYEFVPLKLLTTRQTTRPARQSPAGVVTINHNIEKTTDNQAQDEERNEHIGLSPRATNERHPETKEIIVVIFIFYFHLKLSSVNQVRPGKFRWCSHPN